MGGCTHTYTWWYVHIHTIHKYAVFVHIKGQAQKLGQACLEHTCLHTYKTLPCNPTTSFHSPTMQPDPRVGSHRLFPLNTAIHYDIPQEVCELMKLVCKSCGETPMTDLFP